MVGQHVQGDVLLRGRLGFRLRPGRPLSGSNAHQFTLLNFEVAPAVGRPHGNLQVGGHLYVAGEPAAPPIALALEVMPTVSVGCDFDNCHAKLLIQMQYMYKSYLGCQILLDSIDFCIAYSSSNQSR